MKKLILTVVGLLTLLGSVRATTYEESETAAGAKQYMVEFYQRIGKSDNVTVIDCSPFVHREVDGYDYYIAKVFVTVPSTGQQVVMGVVRDVATQVHLRHNRECTVTALKYRGPVGAGNA